MTNLVQAGNEEGAGKPPLDFVFISACHSDQAGEAFVAAQVPHVVCVRREAQLQDKAACAFADQFYFALFRGKTVQSAFDIAKQAVSNDPSILRADAESDKFLLLPLHGEHGVSLCRDVPDGPYLDCSPPPALCNLPAFFPLQFIGRQAEWQQLVQAAVGQEKRLLTLVGTTGMGKTSLALATAHYLFERACFPGGVFYVHAEGAAHPHELCAMIRDAIAEARAGFAEEEGYAEDADEGGAPGAPPSIAEAAAAAAGQAAAAAALPVTLRRLGRCLVVVDGVVLAERHADPTPRLNGGGGGGGGSGSGGGGGGGTPASGGLSALLQALLQKAPELRLFLTSTEPVALPGVATRQLVLAPMPSREAATLFRRLAPRAISRDELSCDDPAMLRKELQRLVVELAGKIDISDFQLLAAGPQPNQPLKVHWRLPSLHAAAALQRELTAHNTLLQLDLPPVSTSGVAGLVGYLSLPRMLAQHAALHQLKGNPKAISLAVSLLQPDACTVRPLGELGELLGHCQHHPTGAHGQTSLPPPDTALHDVSDADRSVLEQLTSLLAPPEAASPSRDHSRASPPPADRSSSISSESDMGGFGRDVGPTALAGELSRQKLPSSLVLRKQEYLAMMEGNPRWLGSGSLGAVYDVDLGGTRVAVKQFFESSCSSSAFQREALLLAELRHPNIVQLIKVACQPKLCIVTELLVCSLHALLHHHAGGPLRQLLLATTTSTLTMCMHVARGMNYLHTLEPPVLHRNLKSQNLLVDEGGKVKIADFGWSRLKTFDAGKTFFHGWQWVAPEILWGQPFTEAADVYSFGMVSWEVLTQEIPFKGLNPVQIGVAVREQKRRPPLPEHGPHGLDQLLQACWHDQPEQRPSFVKVLGKVQALVAIASTESGPDEF